MPMSSHAGGAGINRTSAPSVARSEPERGGETVGELPRTDRRDHTYCWS